MQETAKASGVDVDRAKADIQEKVGSLVCPHGFSVISTHYKIMLVVLVVGGLLGALISKLFKLIYYYLL